MPVFVHVIDQPDAQVLVDTGMTELHPAVADLDPRLLPSSKQDFDLGVWPGAGTSRNPWSQLRVRALDPELVWLAHEHEHEPWRPHRLTQTRESHGSCASYEGASSTSPRLLRHREPDARGLLRQRGRTREVSNHEYEEQAQQRDERHVRACDANASWQRWLGLGDGEDRQ